MLFSTGKDSWRMLLDRRVAPLDVAVFLITVKVVTSVTIYFRLPKTLQEFLMAAAYGLVLVHVLQKPYRKKELIWMGLVTVLILYTSFRMKNMYYLSAWAMIAGGIRWDIRRMIKVMFATTLVIFLSVCTVSSGLYLLGYDQGILINVRRGDVQSFMFGFVHTNMFSILLSNLCLMYVWLKKEGIRPFQILLLTVFQAVGFCFTKTRTSLIIFLLTAVLILLRQGGSRKPYEKLRYLFLGIGGIYWALSHLLLQNNLAAMAADRILTGRIRYSAYAMQHFGWTFLGQNLNTEIQWDQIWKLSSFTFDSVYSFLFFQGGILWFFLLGAAFVKLKGRVDQMELILLGAWMLYAVTETNTLLPQFGFQILLLSRVFEKEDKKLPVLPKEQLCGSRGENCL